MTWMTHRLGHRGLALLLLGLIWFVFGWGLFLEPEVPAPGAFHQMIPLPIRAAMWITAGSVAMAVGIKGRGGDDSWGHIALWVMPAERLLSYGGAWVLWLISAHTPVEDDLGYPNGWYPALVWLFVVVILRLVAAWPNPNDVPSPPAVEAAK